MTFRRVAAAIAATGVVAAGLAGCAPSTDGADGGDVTLTIWDNGALSKKAEDGSVDEEGSFLHRAAAAYEEENEGVTVDVVQLSGDISQDAAQFQAASIAKNGPDLRVGYTGGNTIDYADFLLPLDDTFSEETMTDLTGWNTVRAGYQEDGDLLGLPYGGGSYFYVFYNKAMVEEAGLDLSTPPATWEELLDDGEQVLDETDHTPFWTTNQEGYSGAWIVAALAGGLIGPTAFTDMFNGDVDLDDPRMVEAYEAYAELFSRGLTNPDAGSLGNSELLTGFLQGNGAFMISGSWENSAMFDAVGDDMGVFPIPMLEDAEYPSTIAGGPNVSVSITNYTKNQEQAEDFLNYLAEPGTIDLYVELNQTEASNSAQADASVITNPYLQAQAEQLVDIENVVYPFDNVMPQLVIDLFYRVNATVFTGQTTAEDAVRELQEAYESEQTE
jgi:ABC-type glycerol-3-phosphate transport system substrate-binding protein